jgi:two-component system, NtrC family, nitrogen regulation response regulator NtrX
LRKGLFELENGGTIFIDENGEMTLATQTKLLRVLEEREFRRVGGEDLLRVDVRVLAATNRDLREQVELGDFRRDLYHRLNVLRIAVPPLRERREDIPRLIQKFVAEFSAEHDRSFLGIEPETMRILIEYAWPGNVRELRNLVNRLLILGGPEEISLAEVEAQLAAEAPDDEPLVKQDLLAMPLREAREHFERAYLQQQLILCNGKVGQLAKRVGMERTHLYRKLRSLGVDFRQVLSED